MQLKGRQKQFVESARLATEKFCSLFDAVAKVERDDSNMEQKISYTLTPKKQATTNLGSFNNKLK
jgi:hypothetical protein